MPSQTTSIRLQLPLADRLDRACKRHRRRRSDLITTAIATYLDQLECDGILQQARDQSQRVADAEAARVDDEFWAGDTRGWS